MPSEIEHILPRSKGGSDRISNLALACHSCKQKKGNLDIQDFLSKKPDLIKRILAQTKKLLADTAAVNAARWELFRRLKDTGLPVSTGTGGQTKFNRTTLGLAKQHWIDAACVGIVSQLVINNIKPLKIIAKGHGTRQMCGTDKFGFPTRHRSRVQIHKGFQTGDIVRAVVKSGKKVGIYVGRVLCRASGSFDIATSSGRVAGISHKYCVSVHRKDGYSYAI